MQSRRVNHGLDQTSVWNMSKLMGAKLLMKPKHVWVTRSHLQPGHRTSDLALFNLAIAGKLRAYDPVTIEAEDIACHAHLPGREWARRRQTFIQG